MEVTAALQQDDPFQSNTINLCGLDLNNKHQQPNIQPVKNISYDKTDDNYLMYDPERKGLTCDR